MTTKTETISDASGSTGRQRTTERTASDENRIAATARQVADSVAGAAGEVTARIPDVAEGARATVDEATRLMNRGSDDSLRLAAAGAVGLALGLFIAGAARILVLLAVVPALMIGATLLERSDGRPGRLAD